MKKTIIIISLVFTVFSFIPSLYEIYHAKDLPKGRVFLLEHNYLFDYNFYLSRIRQGQEGRWLVSEKYYNIPHRGSLMQMFYLYLGKAGGIFRLSPPAIYHLARLLAGFFLLVTIGKYTAFLFSRSPSPRLAGSRLENWWGAIAFLLIVTSGSWPIPLHLAGGWRFGTYMGWWSAIDSLQRIIFLPHVVFGQIFIILFIWKIGNKPHKELRLVELLMWGAAGFVAGIIFPPTLIMVYAVFGVLSVMELVFSKSLKELKPLKIEGWIREKLLPRAVFTLLSFPALIYLKLIFEVMPWKALALFDVQHRMPLPYREYIYALGPVLPFSTAGLALAFFKKEKKLWPVISWMLGLILLFAVFERVPQQSPLRFTEGLMHVPLGILAAYFFWSLWKICEKKVGLIGPTGLIGRVGKIGIIGAVSGLVVTGVLVMASMVFWLTDQADGKRMGTWLVPIGAQLIYPLDDFMDGIYFLRDNTKKESVVLSYVTAGNYIPAYAGNFTFIGHANTPDEDGKEKTVSRFFTGKMGRDEAGNFLVRERISYIYFGPQEKELGNAGDLSKVYPFLESVYENERVEVYKVNREL